MENLRTRQSQNWASGSKVRVLSISVSLRNKGLSPALCLGLSGEVSLDLLGEENTEMLFSPASMVPPAGWEDKPLS